MGSLGQLFKWFPGARGISQVWDQEVEWQEFKRLSRIGDGVVGGAGLEISGFAELQKRYLMSSGKL